MTITRPTKTARRLIEEARKLWTGNPQYNMALVDLVAATLGISYREASSLIHERTADAGEV